MEIQQGSINESDVVSSLNGEKGDITLVAGSNITITPVGQNIIIASTGGGVTSVSGTTNRVTSTGGTTPVIDISAAYVGQASITTVGNITTGSFALGTSASITNPRVAGDPTTGLFQDVSSDFFGNPAVQTIKASVLGIEMARIDATGINTPGGIYQTGFLGSSNVFTNNSVFGGTTDPDSLNGAAGTFIASVFGIKVINVNNPTLFSTYPSYVGESYDFAQTFQVFNDGSAEFLGNLNNPIGGIGTIQNYLLQSENFNNVSWVKTRVTATDNSVVAPNGKTTASTIQANTTGATKSLVQTSASLPAGTYTFSIYLKSDNVGDSLSVNAGGVGISLNGVTTTWQRFSVNFTTSGTGTIQINLRPSSGQKFYAWGAQLVSGSSGGVYFHTTTGALSTAEQTFHTNNNFSLQGTITRYNNISTTGEGVPAIYGSDRKTGQTTAVSLATYTVGATDSSYMVSANVNITTSTLHSFNVICTYTDEGNTSRILNLSFSNLAGTFLQTITNALGAGAYEGIPLHIRAKAGTTIIISTTGTFTTVTYNVEENIMQLQ